MSISAIEKKYANITNYGEFKKDLSDIVVEWISNFQKKYALAEKNFDELYAIVKQTAKICNELTQKKIDDVYKKIGIRK
jgi:tryptophanyl-tRNA synthetase